jgi:leader peptidase (prepilin peptidase)/N-methyltransferase
MTPMTFGAVVGLLDLPTSAQILLGLFAGALGACLASFLAVVIERVPKGESIGGRSHCVCGAPVLARDNLPVIGYLLRGGRARCCGARIPVWYPAIELAGAGVAVAGFLLLT